MDHIACILNDSATARSVLQTGALLSLKYGCSRARILHPRLGCDPSFMPTEEVMTDDRRKRFAHYQDTQSAELSRIFQAWKSDNGSALVFE